MIIVDGRKRFASKALVHRDEDHLTVYCSVLPFFYAFDTEEEDDQGSTVSEKSK